MKQEGLAASLLGSNRNSISRRMRVVWLLFFALTTALVACLFLKGNSFIFLEAGDDNGRSSNGVIESEEGVVAADNGRCSEIGAWMLRKGGHAVDAAVATALCLGVVCPMSSGIGGGAFMVFRSSSESGAVAIDMRETAPLAASQNMYEENAGAKSRGALSMGVPGEIAGLHVAWLKHGRLPWKTLFEPAIELAKNGFIVSPYLGDTILKQEKKIMSDPGLQQVFAPKGKLVKPGDMCYNMELGNTLGVIAELGPEAFYNGEIGKKLIEDVKKAGGILTMEDLRNYRVRITDAVSVNAMGYTIYGMPPPSSGTLGLSLVLKVIESYGSADAAKGPLGLHRLIEALKHMFAIRMNLGDPDFVDISKTVSEMLSPSFAESIREKIFDNTTFPSEYYLPRWSQLRDHGTSHFCVVDAERNVVSMTTTVNYAFGSGVLSPSTGIILNNEMDDFSTPTDISPDKLPPAPTNFIRPNKRPLSSMTPIIVLKVKRVNRLHSITNCTMVNDGSCLCQGDELAGVIGGAGGTDIIPGVIQVFINHFILGMKPLEAVESPRVYHKLIPNVVSYENWTVVGGEHIELSRERVRFLRERRHQLQGKAGGAICQLVVQNQKHGLLTGVCDPRKGGWPAATDAPFLELEVS